MKRALKLLGLGVVLAFALYEAPVVAQSPQIFELYKAITQAGRWGNPRYTTTSRPLCNTPNLGAKIENTTTGTEQRCNGTAYVDSSAAASIATGIPVSGGGANRVLFENGSQNLATDSDFTYASDVLTLGAAGAGTNATVWAKTMSGSSATSNFFSVTGTLPGTLSAEAHAVYIDITADNDAQPQSAIYARLGGVNGGGTDPWAARFSNGATTNGMLCLDDNGTCVVTVLDAARTAIFYSSGLGLGGTSAGIELYTTSAGDTDVRANSSSTSNFVTFTAFHTNVVQDSAVFGTSYAGTLFGVAKAGLATVFASGSSLIGQAVGTTTDDPVYLGRLDLQRYQVGPTKTLADNTITTFATQTLGNDTGGGGTLHYCVYAADATTAGLECGDVDFAGVDVTTGAGGEVCPTPTKHGTPLQALSGSTLTVTFAASTGTDLCNVRVTADTNIASPVSLWITWSAPYSGRVLTAQ
jgi:hypothetical protein